MFGLSRATTIVRHYGFLPRQSLLYGSTSALNMRYRDLVEKKLAWDMHGIQRRGTHSEEITWRPRRNHKDATTPSRIITTLRREKLRPIDYITLEALEKVKIYNPVTREQGYLEDSLHGRNRFARGFLDSQSGRFVKGTGGFLYFRTEPGRPPTSAEIRFRVTPTNDPSSFDEGYDMVAGDGFFWRTQLHRLSLSMRNLAIREGLVTPALLSEIDHIKAGKTMRFVPMLYYLEQPFFFDFASDFVGMECTHNGHVQTIRIFNPTRDYRDTREDRNGTLPYVGSAVLRLEQSTLPEHAGTRTLVYRVLKILRPVKSVLPDYDGYYPAPEKGALISVPDRRGGHQPFSIKLERNDRYSVGLKIFFPGEHDLRPRKHERPSPTLVREHLQPHHCICYTETQTRLSIPLGGGKSVTPKMPIFPVGHPYRRRLNSYAFIYFHKPSDLPATAGEVRLRLTPTPHPNSWDKGHDLRQSRGGIWGITLFDMASDPQFQPLVERLIEEKLIEPSIIPHCKSLLSTLKVPLGLYVLHWLSQPFLCDFSSKRIQVDIVGPDSIVHYRASPIRVDKGQEQYRGKAWTRFEKSQDERDIKKRILKLRVLDRAELAEADLDDDTWGCPDPPYGASVMKVTNNHGLLPYRSYKDNILVRLLWRD